MKKIDSPLSNETVALKSASRNKSLTKTFPKLIRFGLRAERIARYYEISRGNPNIIRLSRISTEEKKAILDLYDDPPVCMGYIGELRDSLAGETCPMCGGENPTTLDHYLTKRKYPEYALLPYNLVPACSCNQKRGERLWDAATGARILHPYYDDCMSVSLVTLQFNPNDLAPLFHVAYLLPVTHPDFENLKFHFESIVLRTNFMAYISKRWEKIKVAPDNILLGHHKYRSDKPTFHSYLVEHSDAAFNDSGANSWKAIFFRSISDQVISDWLYDHYL